ncbi:hypothetical protein E2C01_080475 [Portunus trituberculatus]|uniref:Uncharacterized protein n=1 Tax=Portunus trituberculatus TaxID=210409 RepID=A0A5B7IJU0_PORTR|nr:hypothetical protein [Portunus trituberculatus]
MSSFFSTLPLYLPFYPVSLTYLYSLDPASTSVTPSQLPSLPPRLEEHQTLPAIMSHTLPSAASLQQKGTS